MSAGPGTSTWLVVVFVVGAVAAVTGWVVGHNGSRTGGGASAPTTLTTPSERAGKAVYVEAQCGFCHALSTAGSTGKTGPNLDHLQPSAGLVAAAVRNGSGAMPSYSGQLSPQQIRDVSAFVAASAGR